MPWAVFLRGANVGGKRTFSPAALAEDLHDLGAVNIGAAGTLAIRASPSKSALTAAIAKRLPFQTEIMVCAARDIAKLLDEDPFAREAEAGGLQRFVTLFAARPKSIPGLPFSRPEGARWDVRLVRVAAPFAICLRSRTGPGVLYPNEVVEKALGVLATTRGWDTLLKVRAALA